MGLGIFYLVSGMGVSFLLYVLTNFWKEGRKLLDVVRAHEASESPEGKPVVRVLTRDILRRGQDRRSVIPFQSQNRGLKGKLDRPRPTDAPGDIPRKRVSVG